MTSQFKDMKMVGVIGGTKSPKRSHKRQTALQLGVMKVVGGVRSTNLIDVSTGDKLLDSFGGKAVGVSHSMAWLVIHDTNLKQAASTFGVPL